MTDAGMGPGHGQFVWYELSSPDIAASKTFYKAVFGWETAAPPGAGSAYSFFLAKGVPVAGLNYLPESARRMGASPQWTGYVAVSDVDWAAQRAKELGGSIFVPPSDIPGVSRFTVIADPEGANLILSKGLGQGDEISQRRPAASPIVWHELNTSAPEKALTFYDGLLGWHEPDKSDFSQSDYRVFSEGSETIGGIAAKPNNWKRAFWRYYIQMTGIEAGVKRVLENGGKIYQAPFLLPSGAWVAFCADPGGAIFALMDTAVRVVVGCYSPRNPTQKGV
jgi:predicted enzyme related to lactoylglutathione lyase